MWSIYAPKIRDGQIKYFYKKRLIRLLPALSILLAVAPVFLIVRATPGDRINVLDELLAAASGISNVYYWFDVQYFSSTDFKPFLNLWSIALEFQFYLLFPLIVLFLRNSRKNLVLLTVASFILYVLVSFTSPQSAFYMLPGRLWQFLVGAVIASISGNLQTSAKLFLFSKYALYIFLVALLFIPNSNLSKSLIQLVAVSTSSLFIYSGALQSQNDVFGRILAKVGDYSYSLYLIHFPLFVFLGYSRFEGNSLQLENVISIVSWIVLLATLAWLSKKFIEDNQYLKNKVYSLHVVIVFAICIAFGSKGYISQLGYSEKQLSIASANSDRGVFRCGFWARIDFFNSPSKTCLISEEDVRGPRVLLVGNSHVDSIKEAVVRALANSRVYLLNENNPLNENSYSNYLEGVRALRPSMVIIHSSLGSMDSAYLEMFIRSTNEFGIAVSLIEPVPQPRFNVPEFAWKVNAISDDYSKLRLPKFSKVSYQKDNIADLEEFARLKSAYGINVISVVEYFCNPFCQIADEKSGKLYYFDYTHLTLTGAERVYEALVDARLESYIK